MKEITIKKEVYNLPESWEEISLKQFNDIQLISELETSATRKSIKTLAVLLGIDEKMVAKIPIKESSLIDLSFLQKEIPRKAVTQFTIDDITYSPIKDFNTLSLGEYADIDYYMNNDLFNNIHYIAAIVCRPINVLGEMEEYDSDTLEQRALLLYNKMNIVQLMSVAGFFLCLEKDS